ncbi:uncharacterized protein LOC111033371, partial [Myzus persicae]|uniref:uncharacterized protein LOC111033371 n=1 Tax=Myzus persicae TaxID=13164 RepID=UPI000B9317E7
TFASPDHNKPVLWDQKNPNYYNKYTKNDAWEELATEMGISLDDCKLIVNSLQSSLRREKSKIKRSHGTGTGRDEVYEGTWFAFKSLSFLMDKNIPRSALSTVNHYVNT